MTGQAPASAPGYWSQFKGRAVDTLKGVGAHILTALKWVGLKLLAPGVSLIVAAVAIVLVAMGAKELQVGGLLGWLLGRKGSGGKAIDVANTIPSDRIDTNGALIPEGVPDSKGITQAVVVPIHEPGVFSNPSTVKFTPPGADKPVEVQLPDGVKNKNVAQVVVLTPDKFVVTVKDNSAVPASKVDDLLNKYGGTP